LPSLQGVGKVYRKMPSVLLFGRSGKGKPKGKFLAGQKRVRLLLGYDGKTDCFVDFPE
jgi:hypothetical protein